MDASFFFLKLLSFLCELSLWNWQLLFCQCSGLMHDYLIKWCCFGSTIKESAFEIRWSYFDPC